MSVKMNPTESKCFIRPLDAQLSGTRKPEANRALTRFQSDHIVMKASCRLNGFTVQET